MPPDSLHILDGGAHARSVMRVVSSADAGGRGAVVAVPVMPVSNPLFVCWVSSGSHLPAGTLAIATIVVVLAALPAVLAAKILRDPRHVAAVTLAHKQRVQIAAPPRALSTRCTCCRALSRYDEHGHVPLPLSTTLVTADEPLRLPSPNIVLGVLISDYRPAAWYVCVR